MIIQNLFCKRFQKYGKPFQRSIFQAVLFLSIASRRCFIGNSNIFVDNTTVSITDAAIKIIFRISVLHKFPNLSNVSAPIISGQCQKYTLIVLRPIYDIPGILPVGMTITAANPVQIDII